MAYCPPFEAIVLVGGDHSSLFPLTSPIRPLCLLPVGNKPLISYPLKLLTDSVVNKIFLISQGESATKTLKSWINSQYQTENNLSNIELVEVAEDAGNVDCIKAVMNKISTERVIILTGDVVCDLSINSVIRKHFLSEFDAMVVFSHRRTSASTETKLGKAPKNVDYTVMDAQRNFLLYYVDSPEASREIQLPTAAIQKYGPLTITTSYVDTHVYVFSKIVLLDLCNINSFTNIQSEWLPYLINKDLTSKASEVSEGDADGPQSEQNLVQNKCGVYLIPESRFCIRATTATNYAEINREVVTPELVQKFLNISQSKYDNIVPSTVLLGNKAMIGSSCMVGADTEIGDKTGVKKSVIGRKCKIGGNVKIVNCVLMDNVVVGEGCHLQHSVLCEGVKIGDKCSLKDCQVGEGYQMTEGLELKGEVLAQAKQ